MNRRWLNLFGSLVVLALTAAPTTAQQMWAPGGIRLCGNGCGGFSPDIVPDAAGGAFVAWHAYQTSYDVYLSRITGDGLIAPGWPADGLPVVVLPSDQDLSGFASDGLGGALLAWEDWRTLSTTSRDAYAERVLADGTLPPGWAVNGNPATLEPHRQYLPEVAPDGAGGAYLLWQDDRDYTTNGYDMYGQHLTANGAVAPGWPQDGLAVCVQAGDQGGAYFEVPDDSGGVVFAWSDGRPGAPGGYALRVHADGALAAGWPAGGRLLNSRGNRVVARDEAGGFYAVSPTVFTGFDQSYYLLRYTFDGVPAPGWPADGVLVCSAPGIRSGVSLGSDGAAGALMSWYDYRPPYSFTGGEIFALRVLPNGVLAPGWTADGTLVSDPSDGLQSYDPFVLADGRGGSFVAWQSQGGCCDPSWIEHLTGSGQVTAGWPRYGLRVAPSGAQLDTRLASDGLGGAIVVWHEGRFGVWAQRFAPDAPTPVLVSLASAAMREGAVALDWLSAAGAGLEGTVYRRTEQAGWQSIGRVSADGTGQLRHEDRAVEPGARYAYRLGYVENGVEQFTAETWVQVPALAFALDGLRPNPAAGDLAVSFTLPSAAPAWLKVLDVTGRVRLTREVGALGAGNHLIHLTGEASMPPGVYWLRLTQGGRSLLARGVVVR